MEDIDYSIELDSTLVDTDYDDYFNEIIINDGIEETESDIIFE